MSNRRKFLQQALALGAGGVALRGQTAMQSMQGMTMPGTSLASPTQHPPVFAPGTVQPLDSAKLAWKFDNGVKVFQLVAEPVKQELLPGKTIDLWGFNGSAPGPLIEINEGDRVRIIFDNHLPESTAIHWHGLEVPNDMDGAPGITQKVVKPGERFIYEFTLRQNGTYFYHSHMAMQEMFGMIGGFVIHPEHPYSTQVEQDFLIILQEYAVLPNNPVPNSMNMEFNWLTFNGKAGPATTPLVIRQNQRVKIRLINLGMDHHPIHLHGHQFVITGTEGGRQPESNWIKRNTVLVGVAQAYDVEFEAVHLGEWMLHCHLPHHMMNQMSSTVGPMTRAQGMPAGLSMETAMGMQPGAPALSGDNGASLGRGMGGSSARQTAEGNGPQTPGQTMAMPGMPGMQMPANPPTGPHPNQVPGFPQDAFMEGPMMAMDAAVAKPETLGLPKNWSGFIQGMMTLVRVLPPDQYDQIQKLKATEVGR